MILNNKIKGITDSHKAYDFKNIFSCVCPGFSAQNGSIYKYIVVKNKAQLVKPIIETPKLSFFQERPKMTGGGYNAIGQFQPHGEKRKLYMIKDSTENAEEVKFGKDFKNMAKLFPNCPKLLEYQNDKELRKTLTLSMICDIYNEYCGE